ncbi:RimK family alpha-L-glutamate ligase [Variovorax sp. Sphag1AA]|uniref:ATP-grasp domain-containing protein n=1 Tax=Variovorax sp. Sphag1AA TaxID=2587027 RepID=UPI0016074C44|nr:RimK domain-containing protein ATP-grasp [Variovorax sp. Sphag1AA]MBB3178402.1 glutathione synthase/RimK-type ligase-like ATP-grasp enzyme [Variovorax sp. Sphag1AA]
MSGPVLLWGSPLDLPIASVCTALSRLGTPMFLVDQTRAEETSIGIELDGAPTGWVQVGDQRCELDRIRSAYARPQDSARNEHAAAIDEALGCWLEMTPALVVNRLSTMGSNSSKPYQAALIAQAGFAVPDTLVTNDADALHRFWKRHGNVIYKSCSGVRSIVSRLSADEADRLAHLPTCPTQFQEYVPGTDYRVHVIGNEIHGHAIDSDADDYRYAGAAGVRLRRWQVPDDLVPRLRALAASLGLVMAGIDLRRKPQGEWVCFEVNPSPGFTFYDDEDEAPLARATARLLSEGCVETDSGA